MKKWMVTAGLLTCASLVVVQRVEATEISLAQIERACHNQVACYTQAQAPIKVPAITSSVPSALMRYILF